LEIKVINESNNPLLSRREVTVDVEHEKAGTPDKASIRKAVASRLKAKPESVFIVEMHTATGLHRTRCHIDVYDDPEFGRKVLPKHLIERNFPSPAKPAKKEAKETKPEAKPETKPKAEGPPKPQPKEKAEAAPKLEPKGKAKTEPKK